MKRIILPVIIHLNIDLPLALLQRKADSSAGPGPEVYARIYDRILEQCAPIFFAGKNFREENAGNAGVSPFSTLSFFRGFV